MVLYTFRLTDDNHQMLKDFVVYARSVAVVDLAVFEISKEGKPHIHMLFEPTKPKTKSAWVQAFHKFFKNRWVGNQSYSCTELRENKENFIIYCCKGTRFYPPDVLYNRTHTGEKEPYLTNEVIENYWKKYWEDKPISADKTLIKKTVKEQKPTWSKCLTDEIRKDYPGRDWSYDADDINLIFDIVMKNLGSQSKKLNAFIVRDLVLGQLNALNDGLCLGLNKNLKKTAFPELFGSN